jgi:hypothetical protein
MAWIRLRSTFYWRTILLITSIKVRADRFLLSQDDPDPAEALLVIGVNVKVADPTLLPYGISL